MSTSLSDREINSNIYRGFTYNKYNSKFCFPNYKLTSYLNETTGYKFVCRVKTVQKFEKIKTIRISIFCSVSHVRETDDGRIT